MEKASNNVIKTQSSFRCLGLKQASVESATQTPSEKFPFRNFEKHHTKFLKLSKVANGFNPNIILLVSFYAP